MAAVEVEKHHCGEVFITNNYCMILECKLCNDQFGVYNEFLDHIFDKHFDDSDISKELKSKPISSEVENNSSNEISQFAEINSPIDEEYDYIDEEQDVVAEVRQLPTEQCLDLEVVEKSQIIDDESVLPTTSCSKGSNLRPVLSKPRLTHASVERKYKCKICDFAFTEICNLRSHEQRHTNKKPFTCLKCNKAFFTRTELATHTKRHTGERPFVCAYCGGSFITNGLLRLHEKRHLGERTHKCNQCEKSFYDGYQLRRHAVVHTQERNYSCEECHATFTRKRSLQEHMKLHVNALQYECIICKMRFNQKPTLIWHVKSKHNVLRNEDHDKGQTQLPVVTINEPQTVHIS